MCQNNVGVTEVQRLYKVALQRKLENEEEQKFKEEIKVFHWLKIFQTSDWLFRMNQKCWRLKGTVVPE